MFIRILRGTQTSKDQAGGLRAQKLLELQQGIGNVSE